MRLTTIILVATMLQVSASSFAQKITLSEKNTSIAKVFKKITEQSGYGFFVAESVLKGTNLVTIEVKNEDLSIVLKSIFQDQPISYKIEDNAVIVSRKSTSFIDNLVRQFQEIEASGKILDEKRQGLPGASVKIKGKNQVTTTNSLGEFTLKHVEEGDIIVISYIGYVSKEVKAAKNLGNIVLALSDSKLDEVQVVAYGTTTQRLSTGSQTVVTAKDIDSQPVMNPILALQGLVPGLVITPTSGLANSPVKILVRGRNNISPLVSSDPLILIDGMPITNMNLNGTDQTNGSNILPVLTAYQITQNPSGGESPLFGINPKDIESISILKDADATAIYGSRGANGVILITTKKGKAGATQVNINTSMGISQVSRHFDMMNTTQYVAMRKEALKNDGIAVNAEFAPDLVVWDTTRNVDWQKELWGGTGIVNNVNVGLSGGSGNTSFRLNGGYSRQNGILTVSGGSRSSNLALNLEHRSTDQKFSVSLSSIYSYAFSDMVNQTGTASTLIPNAPPMYDENGALNYAEWNAAGQGAMAQFPFGNLLQKHKSSSNKLNGSLLLKYAPVKQLTITNRVGYNNSLNISSSLRPITAQNPQTNPSGSATFTTASSDGWSIEPQADYNANIGPGKFGVMLGATIQASTSRYNVENGLGYVNDELLRSIVNAPVQAAYDGYGQYKYFGVFARINYNISNKYIVNLNGRRDGSSRFGPGNQFGNFGSVGAAWIVSEEKWFQKSIPTFISFFKLRGSYGSTGSDGVSDYQYLSQWSSGSLNNLIPSYGSVARPLVNQHAVNQNFKWQTNRKLDQAVEIGFLQDSRLLLQVGHYRNRTSNQLLSYPTPTFTGFPNVTANWEATVQNSGWEFNLAATKLIATKDFNWSASFNVSLNKNILYDYPNIENTPYFSRLLVGRSLNTSYVYHFLGVDPFTGQYTVQDFNKDGTISLASTSYAPLSPNSDQQIAIDVAPKYTGGLTTSFNYKGFGLSLLFDFVKQTGRNAYATTGMPGMMLFNQPAEIFNNRWQKPGDIARYSAFSTGMTTAATYGGIYYTGSDAIYTDASFFRLNNLALSYNLPEKATKTLGMRGLNIFINAQNVLMFTNYKGVDPELQSFGTMPLAKVITGGLSLNF